MQSCFMEISVGCEQIKLHQKKLAQSFTYRVKKQGELTQISMNLGTAHC